jgi:hypothetical protein
MVPVTPKDRAGLINLLAPGGSYIAVGKIPLAAKIEQLRAEGQTANKELLLRVEVLESTIQQMPLMLLAALRDAINQVGGGMEDA